MILRIRPLYELKRPTLRRVLELTKPDSVFHERLNNIIDRIGWEPSDEDGVIATVVDRGELVGWARSEQWLEKTSDIVGHKSVEHWDTLEAFTHPDRRGEGIASLAAAGLAVHGLLRWGGDVAVFAPSMMLLARRAGLHPTLFTKVDDEWVRA